MQLELQLREQLEKSDFQKAIEMSDDIVARLTACLADCTHDLALPSFLRRFTAGSVFVYCLNKRIDALQRVKRYQEAVDLLAMLLDQNVYLLSHRGHWYERLSLNVEQHLKDTPQVRIYGPFVWLFLLPIFDCLLVQALTIIRSGLNDSHTSSSHKLALSQRAIRICNSPKYRSLATVLSELPLLVAADPKSITISGRSMPR